MAQIKTKFITDAAITNVKMASMANNTVKANKSGSAGAPSDLALNDITETGSSILTITNGSKAVVSASNLTIQVAQATTSTSGYLSSTDWNTFNGKLSPSLNANQILVGSAGNVATAVSMSGDATIVSSGALTIANNAVSNAKLAQMAANTFKGNNTDSTANALDLSVTQMQTALAIPTASSPLPLNAGGTGVSAASANAAFNALSPMTTAGDIIIGGASGAGTRLGIGTNGQILTVVSGAPAWAAAPVTSTARSQNITLTGTDITNQYVDLAAAIIGSSASINSLELSVVGGPVQLKTVDYTVSLTGGAGGVTRVSFAGDLGTGGAAALVAGDILICYYSA